MISLAQLWIPIVASTVLVFVASSLIHMVLKWHNSDYRKLSNEDDVRAAIRAGSPVPGLYVMPHCMGMEELKKPEVRQKFVGGPIAFLTVKANGLPKMGAALGQWFVLILVVGVIAAYVAGHVLPASASFLQVCRVVGALAFLAYAGGSFQNAIWKGHPWNTVAKDTADSVIYAAVTAATFGWLWPR